MTHRKSSGNGWSFHLGQDSVVAVAAMALLAASLVFGGESRLHELRLALVELAALPLLLLALFALIRRHDFAPHRFSFGLAAAVLALPLVQLIPLPPPAWPMLPGREQLLLALEVTGLEQGWLPLTLTPDRTWRSFLALLPPIAMFLGVLVVRPEERKRLVHFLLAAVLISILLGAAQLSSGSERLYPWAPTDAGNVVGFFANRNHLATLCLIGTPFAVVLGAGAMRRGSSRLPLGLAVIYIVVTVVALGVIRSRAGIILFPAVLAASLLAAWIATGRGRPRLLLLVMVGSAGVAAATVAGFAAGPLLKRFDVNGTREGRFENWPIVAEAAEAYLPLGSGLGSFDSVYRSFEPLEQVDPTFFNQAHNDYLEIWLEAGWLGAALFICFIVWLVRRSWTSWRLAASTQSDLQRASTIAIGAVLLHSAADYPLRTAALATVFGLCCGLLELAERSVSDPAAARERRDSSRRPAEL